MTEWRPPEYAPGDGANLQEHPAERGPQQAAQRGAPQHAAQGGAKEARGERDQLRMQLVAVKADPAGPAKKKRRDADDERIEGLEKELAELQKAHSATQAALAEAQAALAAALDVPASGKPAPVQERSRGFFSRLFGRRPPEPAR